ncbi:MAG: hypothetical protein NTU53_00425 [Planctomycetota bacterium]|nr:hypothetical protein [Planctomycetota bacterium]
MGWRKAPRELIKNVFDRLRVHLTPLGFARRGRVEYVLPIQPRIQGWLGLNRSVAQNDDGLRILPNVGVIHEQVEQIVGELGGLRLAATLAANIGYVMPQRSYAEYEFFPSEDYEPALVRLVGDLAEYGVPYMSSLASLDSLIAELCKPSTPTLDAAYRLPVCHMLRGDRASAIQCVDDYSKRSPMVVGLEYAPFAEMLRREIRSRRG